jgi:hypothetical protein
MRLIRTRMQPSRLTSSFPSTRSSESDDPECQNSVADPLDNFGAGASFHDYAKT